MIETNLFLCMLRTAVVVKFPFESGPTRTASPVFTTPPFTIPLTTVPTYGTDQTSVIEYYMRMNDFPRVEYE